MKYKIETRNVNWLLREYATRLGNGTYVIGVDYLPNNGVDLVLYRDKKGVDNERFEIDRICLVKEEL